jgi:hypothetical protein
VEKQPPSDLEQFIGQSFDAVIDCNSAAPRLTMEEGGYFLDQIRGPFYNLLLDHPLYHHDSLKCTLRDYHVYCLDENHAAYVRAMYPHIRTVGTWIATGSAASEFFPGQTLPPISERPIPVLFSGTYTDPEEVMDAIHALPDFVSADLLTLIELMLADPELTIEKAIARAGEDLNGYLPDALPLYVQSCFLADTYVRSLRRKELVLAAGRVGLPLCLYGNDWEKLPQIHSSLTIHPAVTYTDSFSLMANSRITLNLMPEFKCGFHDRIFSAMLNGSVAASDTSHGLLREFSHGKNILFYDRMRMEDGCEMLREALEKPRMLQEIADQGQAKAREKFSWENLI